MDILDIFEIYGKKKLLSDGKFSHELKKLKDCNNHNDNYEKMVAKYPVSSAISKSGTFYVKIYSGPSDGYQYQEFLNELKQNQMIASLIEKKSIAAYLYLRMVDYQDCQLNKNGAYINGVIIYPHFKNLSSFIKDLTKNQIISVIKEVLTSYTILYQVTTMIHGDLTYDNIFYNDDAKEDNGTVLGGFGKMRKGSCKEYIKEFIWLILQFQYIYKKINKDKMIKEVIQPTYLNKLIGKSYLEVEIELDKISKEQTAEIFDYWLFKQNHIFM